MFKLLPPSLVLSPLKTILYLLRGPDQSLKDIHRGGCVMCVCVCVFVCVRSGALVERLVKGDAH